VNWIVEFDDAARKELRKLDRQAQQEILRYLRELIAPTICHATSMPAAT